MPAAQALARADDDRSVVPEREAKSISVEGTYDTDLVDRRLLEGLVVRQAGQVAARLRKARLSGRTVTVKIRLHDFTTHTRSTTLTAPTDHPQTVIKLARSLLKETVTNADGRTDAPLIAKLIVERRKTRPITTTQLALASRGTR